MAFQRALAENEMQADLSRIEIPFSKIIIVLLSKCVGWIERVGRKTLFQVDQWHRLYSVCIQIVLRMKLYLLTRK